MDKGTYLLDANLYGMVGLLKLDAKHHRRGKICYLDFAVLEMNGPHDAHLWGEDAYFQSFTTDEEMRGYFALIVREKRVMKFIEHGKWEIIKVATPEVKPISIIHS